MAELKTKRSKKSVTSFLNKVTPESKREDALALLDIFTNTTGMEAALWGDSIIGFGSYHYKSDRSTQEGDWPLTGFSPRKATMTIYIMPGFSAYTELLKTMGKHTISNGSCLYIKKLADIHIPTLKKLIKQSVTDMRKKYETTV